MLETIFVQPIFNALIIIYNLVGDMGLSIILLTTIVQLLLAPLYKKQIEGQKAMKDIQPRMKEIQEKHKDNKEKQSQEVMKLWQESGTNPASGCLPLLIQFPVFIAVYYVFRQYLNTESLHLLYSFVSRPETLNTTFYGFLDLSTTGVIWLAIVAGITTYIQTLTMPNPADNKQEEDGKDKKEGGGFSAQFTQILGKQMKGFMPVMTFIIVLQLPSAVGIYWITRNIFTTAQQYLLRGGGPEEEVKVKVEEKKNGRKAKQD